MAAAPELSDAEVYGSPGSGSGELSDEAVYGAQPTSWFDTLKNKVSQVAQIDKNVLQGAKATIGQNIRGIAEAIPQDEDNAERAQAGRFLMQGVPYDEAVAQAREMRNAKTLPAPLTAAEMPLGKLGKYIEDVGTQPGGILAPHRDLGVVGDVASGAGSLAGTVLPALAGPGGVNVAKALLPFAGSSEAADRARKAGASPSEVLKAAQYGTIAGATDLVDLELARAGLLPGGKIVGTAAQATRSVLRQKLIQGLEGGVIEGTQEGVQQFIQNLIAKGVYNPLQNLWDEVGYNAFIGGIVGGGARPVLSGSERPTVIPGYQQEAALRGGGVQSDVTPGAPPPNPPLAPGSPIPGTIPPAPGIPDIADVLGTSAPTKPAAPFEGGEPDLSGTGTARGNRPPAVPVTSGTELSDADVYGAPPPSGPNDYGAVAPTPPYVGVTSSPDPFDNVVQVPPSPPVGDPRAATFVDQTMPSLREGLPSEQRVTPNVSSELLDRLRYTSTQVERAQEALRQAEAAIEATPQGEYRTSNAYFAAIERRNNVKASLARAEQSRAAVVEEIRGATGEILTDARSQEPSKQALFNKGNDTSQNFRAKVGSDSRVSELLGISQYGNLEDTAKIAVKELMQNSFDALKGALERKEIFEGNINISTDPKTNTVSVFDDGSGVPPEVLRDKFFMVGGTQKTTERASGGFGIAKLSYQNPSTKFRVVTAYKGKVYEVVTNGEQLQQMGKSGSGLGPEVQVREPTKADQKMFPFGHGTFTEVTLPKEYLNQRTGQVVPTPIPVNAFEFPVFKSPLFDPINVTFNGTQLPIGTKFPINDYKPVLIVKAPWGDMRIIRGPHEEGLYYNATILSNGLYQFDMRMTDEKNNTLPYRFFIDLAPKVEPGKPGYPIALDRQQFASVARDDITQVQNFLSLQHLLDTFKGNVTNYGEMQHISRDPQTGRPVVGAKTRLQLKAPLPQTVYDFAEGAEIQVKGGKLSQKGNKPTELTLDEMKNFRLKLSELRVDQSLLDPNVGILHDNTAIKMSRGDVRTISDLAREKYGERFDQYMLDLNDLFMELRDAVSNHLEEHFPNQATDTGQYNPYSLLKKEPVGVSFDPEYRGVSIRIPFSGQFLNPAIPESMLDPIFAANAMLGTMVHELAHYQDRTEDRREMQRLTYVLTSVEKPFSAKTGTWFQFHQKMVDVVNRNWEIQKYLNGVFTNGVFDISSRGTSLKVNPGGGPEAIRGVSPELGTPGARTGRGPGISEGFATGTEGASTEPNAPAGVVANEGTSGSPTYVAGVDDNLNTLRKSEQRYLNTVGDPGVTAAPRQPEVDAVVENLRPAFAAVGGIPTPVRVAATHASRMNRWYKYMAALSQLVKANPNFAPLLRYAERIRLMHIEESKWHDAALRVEKRWRSLGGDQADQVAAFLDALTNMEYLTPAEVVAKVVRNPNPAEVRSMVAKYRLGTEAQEVVRSVHKMFEVLLTELEKNAIAAASRIITDPVILANKINQITAEIAELRRKPYFPFMRFGDHWVMVKDARGKTISFETFERRGIRTAQSQQMAAFAARTAAAATGETVTHGILPEFATQFAGMPPTLLDAIKTELSLTPLQLAALEEIQLAHTPALAFRKRMFKSNAVPGYSHDFRRAFARYFFHGGRYYARTKHAWALRSEIETAGKIVNDNKANLIRDFMDDHLTNTVLDAKGDFGIFKGAIFQWALGWSVAAAAQNLSQTPIVSYPWLAGKFGGLFGNGDARAITAITKAMVDVRNFYKRGAIDALPEFAYRALGYGIRTGRVSETQAAELAEVSASKNLLHGVAPTSVERGAHWFLEHGAMFFETAEQFNRRVIFRAALELAQKHPDAKAVKEAVHFYEEEYKELQRTGLDGKSTLTEAEAAAVVTAAYATDQTQFVYAKYDRARFMRGKTAGTLLVFKKFMHSMLFLMGQNKADFLPRYLLVMMALGGAGGIPGYDDLRDMVRALAYQLFGKDFNLDREIRKYILQWFDGTVSPDIALHGLARKGFGLPAIMDLMGSAPPRGLTGEHSSNVPMPVLDRSRAISMGNIDPLHVGKLFGPMKDVNQAIAESTQSASGAVFSVGFNMYKALMNPSGEPGFQKRWEPAMPRALGDLSQAYRAYSEGRERSKGGGPNSAATLVPFDTRDTEQMMEIIAMGLGYQPLRLQAKWDSVLAKAEVTMYYNITRNGLLQQYFEANRGGDKPEIDAVIEKIKDYNSELPDWNRANVITPDTLKSSVTNRAREVNARESGIPTQTRNIGISREVDRLFPETTVDVRRIR